MIEPVQNLVTAFLENDGYFVRSNVRFATPSPTPTGSTSAYSDLDIIAVKIDAASGDVTDRLWAEVKAHLTSSLTPGYLRGFLDDYKVMLDLDRAPLSPEQIERFRLRQEQAVSAVTDLLGPTFRRCLYFGGRVPRDGGAGAREYFHPDLEIVYVRDLVRENLTSVTHQHGNDPLFRMINMLSEYRMLVTD